MFEFPTGSPSHFSTYISLLLALSKLKHVSWCGNKEKLKQFNLSLLDVSGEYTKEADIALVFLSPDSKHAAQYRQKIEAMLERYFGEYLFTLDFEEI